jgi:tetratricopeptide (TPR) repeat protein
MTFSRIGLLYLLLLASSAPALAQNVPLAALDNWMWYNENGWKDLDNGKYDRAEQNFRRAIKELEPYPPGNRKLMARTYCDLARVFYYQKRYADAEPLAKWALVVRDADKKSSSDSVFQTLFTLASIQTAQEHFSDAEPLFKRALALQEKELTASHVNTLVTLERLAFVLRSQGKYHEADPLYRRAIAIHERKMPDENLDLADLIDEYVILLRKMNRTDEAEEWQARALRIRDTAASKAARAKANQVAKTLKGFK